jgi:hypothetical protein
MCSYLASRSVVANPMPLLVCVDVTSMLVCVADMTSLLVSVADVTSL